MSPKHTTKALGDFAVFLFVFVLLGVLTWKAVEAWGIWPVLIIYGACACVAAVLVPYLFGINKGENE